MKFDNTNAGTAAQAGIELNNNAGQALITFYWSNYSSASLQNMIYYKNAVGGMKFLGYTGSSIGFGIGTTAAEAISLTVSSSNNVGIGTASPTQKLDVNGNGIRIQQSRTIAASSTACNQGEIAWDANYVYVCVSANSWRRSALASW